MNKFLERLNAGEILVADGATGSNLQKMGLKPGRPPEDLIIDNPDIILSLARSFVEAGSDIILTCTFGGTRMSMKDSKYQDRTPEVNVRAAELARKAASVRGGRRRPVGHAGNDQFARNYATAAASPVGNALLPRSLPAASPDPVNGFLNIRFGSNVCETTP